MTQSVFEQLERWLRERDIDFAVSRHEPVYTSQQAADVRGATLASGAKALVCKTDDRFVMFVLPADRRLAGKQVRKQLALRSLRFATPDEVHDLTGLAPGAIPPFGSLFALATYCDARLAEQERINFNAGDHSISIQMRYDDYIAAERPQLGSFAE